MTRGILAAALLGTTALTGTAFAQDAAVTLDQVTVETGTTVEAATGEVEGYAADATLSGAKTATPLSEVPQSVSVIGTEEMSNHGATKADEALRYTAGVFAQPFGYDSDTDWMFIRGFQATADGTYLDGMQNYSYAFGGLFVDSFLLDRIEVLKGASSVLYGGSNPGGLVNYVTKKPTGERIRYVESGITDSGRAYLGFDISDTYKGEADYRVVGKIQGGDGYTDFEEGIRGTISPSLTLHLNDATKLTLLANYTAIDETHGGGGFLPYVGTVVDASFGRIDPDANFTEPDLDYYKRNQASLGYEFEHVFDAGWTLRHKARYTKAEIKEHSLYAYGYSAEPLLTRYNFAHHTVVDTLVSDTNLEGTVNTGPIEHRLLAGVDYKLYNIDQTQAFTFGTAISAANPVYGATQADPAVYLDQVLTQQQLGGYLQDQIKLNNWIMTLNGRYDAVWTDTTDYYNGGAKNDGFDGAFSGRAGLAYAFDNGLTPYASISTFFNPQIGTDYNGDMYEPETGTQYEVGMKYAPTFLADSLFTVALFDLTRQNVLTDDPDHLYYSVQTGEVRSRGVEVEAKTQLTDQLKATAAFTAYDVDITEDTDTSLIGKTPYIVPEIMGSLWLEYGFDENVLGGMLDGISIGGGLRYIGESWADNANTYKVPDVTLFDAHLGYSRENWGVDFNVNNVFDKTYVASCQDTTGCAYGEGRTMMLRAHATW